MPSGKEVPLLVGTSYSLGISYRCLLPVLIFFLFPAERVTHSALILSRLMDSAAYFARSSFFCVVCASDCTPQHGGG